MSIGSVAENEKGGSVEEEEKCGIGTDLCKASQPF